MEKWTNEHFNLVNLLGHTYYLQHKETSSLTNSEAFSATISWLVRITNQIPLVTSMYYSIGLHNYYPPATSLNPPLQSPLPVDPYPPTSLWLPYSLNFLWFNQFSFLLSTQNHWQMKSHFCQSQRKGRHSL